jgi:hypothetical protein
VDDEIPQDGCSARPQRPVPSATLIPFRSPDNPPTPKQSPISQPDHPFGVFDHNTPRPPNDNENSYPMLDPNAQLRVVHAWMDAMRQVASLRNIILTGRIDVKREQARCSQEEETFKRHMDSFMATITIAQEHGTYQECKANLEDLSRKVKMSGEELSSLRKGCSEREDNVSNHEYQLTRLEEHIYHQIDAEYRFNSIQPTTNSSHGSLSTQVQAVNNTAQAPSNARDELYSRMGDLRILLDRLSEFEYELRQELDERDVLRATGQIDVSDDKTFFEGRREDRAKLQQELEETQADVERLKHLCRRKGIDFEDVHFHNPFYSYIEADGTYSTLSTQAEASKMPLPESPSGILDAYFSKQERVENWVLEDPSSSGPTLTGTAGTGADERARRESDSSYDRCMSQSPPLGRRPSSARSAGDNEAFFGMPQWMSGPPPGSEHIAALLKESMTEATERKMRNSI